MLKVSYKVAYYIVAYKAVTHTCTLQVTYIVIIILLSSADHPHTFCSSTALLHVACVVSPRPYAVNASPFAVYYTYRPLGHQRHYTYRPPNPLFDYAELVNMLSW